MSCSDVCLDMDVDCYNEFSSSSIVTARKLHNCCECGDVISVGMKYERASGKSDGEVWTAKTCMLCAEIRGAFVCGGWIYGGLVEALGEEMFPVWNTSGPLDCLAKLDTLEARNKVRGWYVDWSE